MKVCRCRAHLREDGTCRYGCETPAQRRERKAAAHQAREAVRKAEIEARKASLTMAERKHIRKTQRKLSPAMAVMLERYSHGLNKRRRAK